MKIALCTLSVGEEYKEKTKWTTVNKKSYCAKHGYTFIDDETILDKSRPIPWSKIHLLLKYLNEYDYLVWIDADILIMNMEIKLESFIERYSQYDQICGSDWRMENTGVWFIKNSDFSHNFLKAIWDNEYDEKEDPKERYMNWEQGSFINLLDKNFLQSKYRVKVTQPHEMNSYWYNYYPKHFVLHFAGVRSDTLKWLIQDYYPEKLEGIETDEAYQKRMVWLSGPVRDYLDQKLAHDKEQERLGMIQNLEKVIQEIEKISEANYHQILHKNYHHMMKLDIANVDLQNYKDVYNVSKPKQKLLQIGFETGCETLLFLLANDTSKIWIYDQFETSKKQFCYKYLDEAFPNRLRFIKGDPNETLNKHEKMIYDFVYIQSMDLISLNGFFYNSMLMIKFDSFLVINRQNENVKILWEGYVKDNHVKDVSNFLDDKSHYYGFYIRL